MTTRTLDYQGYVSAQDPRTMPGSVPPPTITAPIQDVQTNYSGGTGNTANPGTSADVGGQFGDIINLLKQYQQGGQTTLNQATNAQIFRGLSVPQGLEGASPQQQDAARGASQEALNPTIGGARDVISQAKQAIQDYTSAQNQARDDARAVINNILSTTDPASLHNLNKDELALLEKNAGYPKGFLSEAVTYKQKQEALANRRLSPTTPAPSPGNYSTMDISRYSRAANAIVKNFIGLPQYNLTANGLPYLQRIQAADSIPGSVSDAELLDSIVKLNTGGNQVTEAQVKLITGGRSYADALNVWKNKLGNGGVLSTAQRQQLTALANKVFERYKTDYQPIYEQATKQLKAAGIPEAFWTIPDLNTLSNSASGGSSGGTSAGSTYQGFTLPF